MPTLDIQQQQRYWRRSILIPLWTQQLLIQVSAGVVFWMIISNFWNAFPGHGGGQPAKSERWVLHLTNPPFDFDTRIARYFRQLDCVRLF